jgi:hypothetical protein
MTFFYKAKTLQQQGESHDANFNINEKWLWHGTGKTQEIVYNGFQEKFNTTAAHGYGNYFATTSNYSFQSQYSKISIETMDNGENYEVKRILLCRVLCGESIMGRAGDQWPSEWKPGVPYHSFCDYPSHKSIFVVKDDCAFPEFILIFRRKM